MGLPEGAPVWRLSTEVTVIVLLSVLVGTATAAEKRPASVAKPPNKDELRAARALDVARGDPLRLRALLERMPKGADLHMHLSGAVYAETLLDEGAHDSLCVNPTRLSLAPAVGTTRSVPAEPVCAEGNVRASQVLSDQALYDSMVDSLSMRSFVPSAGDSGHDHFFATFGRFSALHSTHIGEWLDEVATRAAAQNEQYLEIMHTPSFPNAIRLASAIGWPSAPQTEGDYRQDTTGTSTAELALLRDKLLAGGLREEVAKDRAEFAAGLQARDTIEHCGQSNATSACHVRIRFLFQLLRANRPELVFATALLAFEVAQDDTSVVGINLVQPEDARVAMSEYTRQMRMIGYLHSVYPRVHIALHAGELAPGLVPPEGLRFHIRQAVELAHAERIGHGVDVMYEDDPELLLREMAERHVMVEVNLTSNDVILGVSTNRHSLPQYRAAGVPVALATDDEGVSRIDFTHEVARAVVDFHLGYLDLKAMARTSLEHSFLPGVDLWAEPETFEQVQAVCQSERPGAEHPSARCAEFLHGSARAAEEWELEHRFHVFEATLPEMLGPR